MKIITTVIIILFAIGVVFLGAVGLQVIIPEKTSDSHITDKTTDDIDTSKIYTAEEEKIAPEITKIEIYLGGNRDNGIFLGEANYGLSSEDASLEYGKDYLNTGYSLIWETTDYKLKEGLTYYIYVYAFISGYGWEYIREEIKIPGKSSSSDNIHLYIDRPKDGSTFGEEIEIYGWTADKRIVDNPGILDIKVYLNGPEGSGKFLGDADYGIERPDVAEVTKRENWLKSGYSYKYDGLLLEPGSDNTFFIYANSVTGEYRVEKVNIRAEGIAKEMISKIYLDDSFIDKLLTGRVEIKGWAAVKDIEVIPEDKPVIFEDREYENEKIVFTASLKGNQDIFIMNVDGSEITQLTDHPGNDMYPSPSPDGKKIAYTSDIDGSWQIMVMDWDGQNKVQLTNDRNKNGFPTWSFDMKYIFYEAYIEGSWEIFRINSDGSNIVRLTFNPGADDWHPSGHPFEHKVLFESGKPGAYDLYIMDYDGSNVKRLSDFQMNKRVPDMSRDGSKIVFMGYEGKITNIFIMDSDGTNVKKLTDKNAVNSHPNFSPDGKYITYNSNITGDDEIYIMNIDGSNQTKLTDTPGNSWDPAFLYQE